MFSQTESGLHRSVRTSRHPIAAAARKWLQRTYRGHGNRPGIRPYLDPDWRDSLRRSTHSAFWELFLAETLRSVGHTLAAKSSSHGPDLAVLWDERRTLWVEATAPGPGIAHSADRVPELPTGIASRVPTEQIILRITGALREKYGQIQRHFVSGIIRPTDPVVIAVNWHSAANWHGDTSPSIIERACLGAGDVMISIDAQSGKVVDRSISWRPEVDKASGARCDTTFFVNPEQPHAEISAIVFAANQIAGHTGLGEGALGAELTVLINPRATNPLPRDFLRIGESIVVLLEGDSFIVDRQTHTK